MKVIGLDISNDIYVYDKKDLIVKIRNDYYKEGYIVNFEKTYDIIKKNLKRHMDVVIFTIPSFMTDNIKVDYIRLGKKLGAKKVYLVSKSVISLIGQGTDVYSCSGNLVVEIGSDYSSISSVSLGINESVETLNFSPEYVINNIIKGIKKTIKLDINIATGYKIIDELYVQSEKNKLVEITGYRGEKEVTITVSHKDIDKYIKNDIKEFAKSIKSFIKGVTPLLRRDINSRGIIIITKYYNLNYLYEILSKELDIPIFIENSSVIEKGFIKYLNSKFFI